MLNKYMVEESIWINIESFQVVKILRHIPNIGLQLYHMCSSTHTISILYRSQNSNAITSDYPLDWIM